MKLLNKKISPILKLVLLFSLIIGETGASTLVSSDRFLLKIVDKTISLQDFKYQSRNLRALNCIYEDAFVVQYFEKSFIRDWENLLDKFPTNDEDVAKYLHQNEDLLKKIRYFFKVLRYSEDQKMVVSSEVIKLIRSGVKENKCERDILYKDDLKTNFLALLQLELYFRSRYASQLKSSSAGFAIVKPSIDLFMESLDKQFGHEYFW
jgi:hypothetical protein